jgi:putative transposase
MFSTFLSGIKQQCKALLQRAQCWLKSQLKPAAAGPLMQTLSDVTRPKAELVLENAFLRTQRAVLKRQVKRPNLTTKERILMLWLASKLPHWKQALLILQLDTVLHWHRDLFKWLWRRKSRHTGSKSPVRKELIALIRHMATENRRWGAERIRGELLKLGRHASKSSIQKYIEPVRTGGPSTQTWQTFVHNHADALGARDFVQVTNVFFRSLYAFVIVEVGSRRVVQIGVTAHPSDAWVAQQLRNATPFGQGPRYLIRDNDKKYGALFAKAAADANIAVLKPPFGAPKANSICERFIGSLRRECLDHVLIVEEGHLRRVLAAYGDFFNTARPHQGRQQQVPIPVPETSHSLTTQRVLSTAILGGLHHVYAWAA